MNSKVKSILKTLAIIPAIFLLHFITDQIIGMDLGWYIIKVMAEGVALLGTTVVALVKSIKLLVSKIKENKSKDSISIEKLAEGKAITPELKSKLAENSSEKQKNITKITSDKKTNKKTNSENQSI